MWVMMGRGPSRLKTPHSRLLSSQHLGNLGIFEPARTPRQRRSSIATAFDSVKPALRPDRGGLGEATGLTHFCSD